MDVFIVTRFSLRIGGWIERIGVNEEEREEWFRYRAEIFRQTALPAVKRQTYEIKQYFLLLDVGDESLYYSCLGDSEEVTPLFCVASEANQLLETKIQAQTKDPTLVARLDSDDLIADNYVENLVFCTNKKFVQDRAKKEKVIFLKAPNGFRMDWKWMQEIKIENPPFLASFYSQFRPPLDLGGDHTKINARNPIACNGAVWVQFVHGSNVANRLAARRLSKITQLKWPSNVYLPKFDGLNSKFRRKNIRTFGSVVMLVLLRTPGGGFILRVLRRISSKIKRVLSEIRPA